jgi:crotonobetainyl-CoA:carnitine CoA-transferase CaiB-like acyl-CoA transferase
MVAFEGRRWSEPNGSSLPKGSGPTDRLYQGGDGEWFYLAAPTAADTRLLVEVEGVSDYAGLSPAETEIALTADFVEEDAAVWVQRLQAAGLGAHALIAAEDLAASELAADRGLTITAAFPAVGTVRTSAPSRRLSETPPVPGRRVGPPGSDTVEVLRSIGLADDAETLLARGVVRAALTNDILAK